MNTIQARDSVQENLSVFSELKQRSTEYKLNVGNRGYITSAILFSLYYCVFCRLSAFHTNDFPSGTGLRNSHTYRRIMRNYRATLC